MNARLRRLVWQRAKHRCEYCLLHQRFDELPHHIDHIIALKHDGSSLADNLALACANCSLYKGSNIAGRDPRTTNLTRLFHPRTDTWSEHFRLRGAAIVGRTAIGRTTVVVLKLNQPERIALRELLIAAGTFPD